MNMLMIAVLVVGAVSLHRMQREMLPTFALEMVTVRVPYPGASAQRLRGGDLSKDRVGDSIDRRDQERVRRATVGARLRAIESIERKHFAGKRARTRSPAFERAGN